ncbi:type VII secretion-associated serine protease mycosin [Saccharopolyspora rhizosphaerae]|uniref:Type VII secretion-associated serine protease mycosin n=1 Tax=Saccharopolyspora rhizosphaerae TaxID=2492662 RepID=A0A3R8Q4J4_9PSEU|nr:type VII secretion-associated serine protease mycosin [Saccharopolyspora rhizosphaerae]RRO12934.1 type VII secretion-associated serine protease mycosin [Saccharopolyspora rhizosphaerae]
MGFKHPRSRGARRGLALCAAVGVLGLSGPTAPAIAQQVGPPALDPSQQTGSSLDTQNYPQKQGCMSGSPGSTIPEKPWSQLVLGYEKAHELGLTGASQKVAVIDTGVNNQPLLGAGAVESGGTSITADGRGTQDCDGHGTIVAGIITADPDPTGETGYVGVAPDARVLSIRQTSNLFVDDGTNSTVGNTETMAQAINLAAGRGATVINISQSSCQAIAQASRYGDAGNQKLHNAVVNAYNQGIVIVAAAGNVGGNCQKNSPGSPSTAVLPAWFDDYVLTVASVNQEGAPSEFTVPGPWVDVAAPGENLIAVDPGVGGNGLVSQISEGQDGQMGPIQGTSFAAPYVSGVAALIKEKFPTLKPAQVMERIKTTALHPGGVNGRNDIVGYGMIDPMAALQDVVPAEHGKPVPPKKPTRLAADALQQKDFPAIIVAIGGAGVGVAGIVFTAFLTNAIRSVRARARQNR